MGWYSLLGLLPADRRPARGSASGCIVRGTARPRRCSRELTARRPPVPGRASRRSTKRSTTTNRARRAVAIGGASPLWIQERQTHQPHRVLAQQRELSSRRISFYDSPQSQSRQRRAWPMGTGLAIALSVSPAGVSNGVAFRTGSTTAPEIDWPRCGIKERLGP